MVMSAIWRKLNAGAELHEERVQFNPKFNFSKLHSEAFN